MLDAIFSAAGGGIFGLIGAGVKTFTAYKEKKLQFEHEVNMAREDRENMTLELELSKQQGAIDLELQESDADARNLTASIHAESEAKASSPIVQDIKSLTRPVLTLILVLASFACVLWAQGNPYTNDIIFMAMTAVTFWFGTRPLSTK